MGVLQQQVALGAAGGWQVEKETPVPLPATTTTNHPTIHSAKTWIFPKKHRHLLLRPESRNCPIMGGAVERERLGR